MKNILMNGLKTGTAGFVVGVVSGKLEKDNKGQKASWKKAFKNGLIIGSTCTVIGLINGVIDEVLSN